MRTTEPDHHEATMQAWRRRQQMHQQPPVRNPPDANGADDPPAAAKVGFVLLVVALIAWFAFEMMEREAHMKRQLAAIPGCLKAGGHGHVVQEGRRVWFLCNGEKAAP